MHSLRKLLGHKRLDTTQIYARVYDDTLYRQYQEAILRLEIVAAGRGEPGMVWAPLEESSVESAKLVNSM